MKERILGLLLVIVFTLSLFAGCGTSVQKNTSSKYDSLEAGVDTAYGKDSGIAEETIAAELPATEDKSMALTEGGNASQNVSNAILSERKVIRSANISIEVEDFNKAYGEIDTIILGIGFIQSSNINSEKYYVEDKVQKLIRRGTIVVRVDRVKFDKALNSFKGIGEVLNESINGEDVTDKYFDTEARVRLLRIELGKLEEYLKKLNDLDQIFKIESRITELQYQIEALTGNLKKLSDLVELSTITININEKYPDSVKPPKEKTYGQKLLDNFLDSMKGVISFIGELVIILVAAIPVLVMLGLFALLAVFIYKKIPKKKAVTHGKTMVDEKKDGNDFKS